MNTKRFRFSARLTLGLALIVLLTFGGTHSVQATTAGWATTHPMLEARYGHTATLLQDGRVLVVGGADNNGYLSSAELYNPSTGFWTSTDSLAEARANHTVTLLPNGNVLIVGGESNSGPLASTEVYDPDTGIWTNTEALTLARSYHTATLLSNGLVLVVGGSGSGGLLGSAELYDPATSPATGFWTDTGSLTSARHVHTAALLSDGRVLVAGGYDNSGAIGSAELYNPDPGTWSDTDSMTDARYYHTLTLLSDGKVLVAGGLDNSSDLASAELYDPVMDTWSPTGALPESRSYHTATRLPNGEVLVTGGGSGNFDFLATAELYDPVTGTWANTGAPTQTRVYHTATLLLNSEVLVVEGLGLRGLLASAELYGASVTPPSTRFVATTGTNVGNGCFNASNPCATIVYAMSQAVAGNTIEIAAGTYNEAGEGNTFSRAGIVVNKNLTLTGAGAANTIVQVAADINFHRVIYVISGVTATIEGMTIQNGSLLGYGGGLYNDGTVTLNFSTVRNNSTGIWGGGIFNSGTLTLNNSTVSDNYADIQGGGIFNTGTMILNNSTVSDNLGGSGSGLYNEGTLTITNGTFSGNGVGGGGGVMNNGGTLNLYNTILANSGSGGDCNNNSGMITGNNNLIEGTGSNACGLTNGTDGNIIGSDPNLGVPIGSPAYFPLNSDSLAIDAGDDAKCAAAPVNNISQNGLSRPQGAHCDIGAYEFANSLAGFNVPVEPVDATTGTIPVAMSFAQITQSGMTNLTTSSSGPPPPAGFSLGDPPIYYELTTTAVFSGTITLCIDYSGTGLENDPDENTFKLYHLEGVVWQDRTASLDTVNDLVCGNVTSLSPFAIFQPTAIFNWTGFFQPVDNLPTLNSVNAGRAIPIKFSLGGDYGLNILMAGYPKSQEIFCDSTALVDGIEETVTAGSSSLIYDPTIDQYTYVWKTEKSWATKCRQLVVKLLDGTTHYANFQFK